MSPSRPSYTSQELGFFARIAEEPLDDTPRLIYADWLEERGDPLAEVIRVECELHGHARVGEARYYALHQRYHRLRHEFDELWQDRLKDLPLEFVGTDRGLVDSIYITPQDFTECAAELFALCPWLSRLCLKGELTPFPPSPYWSRIGALQIGEGAEKGWLESLLRSGNFTRLMELEIWEPNLNKKDVAALADSPVTTGLQKLGIWRSNLHGVLLKLLTSGGTLQNLRTLRLGMNEAFRDRGAMMLALWPGLAAVERLDLDDSAIGSDGALALAQSPYVERLVKLSLQDNQVGDEGAAALLTSPRMSRLHTLDLGANNLSNQGVEALSVSPGPARFKSLSMRFNGIGDVGASYLAESPQVVECEALEIGDQVGPAGARSLARSEQLRHLRLLALAGNPLGNDGARELADATSWTSLEDLFLLECMIGPQGVSALAHAPFAGNLVRLALDDNPIGNTGAETIAASSRLTRLASLSLQGADIEDQGAKALAQASYLDSLQELDLSFNPINKSGARAFATAPHLPNLIQLWLPDAESQDELEQREQLLRNRFGPTIDLGEVGVEER